MAETGVYNSIIFFGSFCPLDFILIHLESSPVIWVEEWYLGQHVSNLMPRRCLTSSGEQYNILNYFINDRHHRIAIDRYFNIFTHIRSGVPQDSVLCSLLFIFLY